MFYATVEQLQVQPPAIIAPAPAHVVAHHTKHRHFVKHKHKVVHSAQAKTDCGTAQKAVRGAQEKAVQLTAHKPDAQAAGAKK